MSNYIPELQSLCARQLANQCRNMNPIERYVFFKTVPNHLKVLIKSFPIDFIKWCGDEYLLCINVTQYYQHSIKGKNYIIQSYKKDCLTGITRRKVIWRKCHNTHCDNLVLQKIIAEPENIFLGLCKECKDYRLSRHIWMMLLLEIEKYFVN